MSETPAQRLENRLKKIGLSEDQIAKIFTVTGNTDLYRLAGDTSLIQGGDKFPLLNEKSLAGAPGDQLQSGVRDILTAAEKNPVYCCIGLSGRSEKKGISGQISLGVPFDTLQLLLATAQYAQAAQSSEILVLLGDGVANANASLGGCDAGRDAIRYAAQFYTYIIGEVFNALGVENYRVVSAAELAEDPRHAAIHAVSQRNIHDIDIPVEVGAAGYPYYARQIADELTLRLQTRAAIKISWTAGGTQKLDEMSFDVAHENFQACFGVETGLLNGLPKPLFFYTHPGTSLGAEPGNVAPYYCLGEDRLLLSPGQTIDFVAVSPKLSKRRFGRIAAAAMEFTGGVSGVDNVETPENIAKYCNWLLSKRLGGAIRDAYNGTAPALDGLPPVHTFLGWRNGDAAQQPTSGWQHHYVSQRSASVHVGAMTATGS